MSPCYRSQPRAEWRSWHKGRAKKAIGHISTRSAQNWSSPGTPDHPRSRGLFHRFPEDSRLLATLSLPPRYVPHCANVHGILDLSSEPGASSRRYLPLFPDRVVPPPPIHRDRPVFEINYRYPVDDINSMIKRRDERSTIKGGKRRGETRDRCFDGGWKRPGPGWVRFHSNVTGERLIRPWTRSWSGGWTKQSRPRAGNLLPGPLRLLKVACTTDGPRSDGPADSICRQDLSTRIR